MGSWGREDTQQGSRPCGQGRGWLTGQPHIRLQIVQEEQLGARQTMKPRVSVQETKDANLWL